MGNRDSVLISVACELSNVCINGSNIFEQLCHIPLKFREAFRNIGRGESIAHFGLRRVGWLGAAIGKGVRRGCRVGLSC